MRLQLVKERLLLIVHYLTSLASATHHLYIWGQTILQLFEQSGNRDLTGQLSSTIDFKVCGIYNAYGHLVDGSEGLTDLEMTFIDANRFIAFQI